MTYILDLALVKDIKANVAEGLVIRLVKETFGVIICAQWPAAVVLIAASAHGSCSGGARLRLIRLTPRDWPPRN